MLLEMLLSVTQWSKISNASQECTDRRLNSFLSLVFKALQDFILTLTCLLNIFFPFSSFVHAVPTLWILFP